MAWAVEVTYAVCSLCRFRGYKRMGISWTSICTEKGFDVVFQGVTMMIMVRRGAGISPCDQSDDLRVDGVIELVPIAAGIFALAGTLLHRRWRARRVRPDAGR